MIRLVRLAWLLLVWLALWGDVTVANVASGLLVGGAVVVGFDTWQSGDLVIRPLKVARFAGFFAYQLVVSSLTVARTVIWPKGRVYTAVVACRCTAAPMRWPLSSPMPSRSPLAPSPSR